MFFCFFFFFFFQAEDGIRDRDVTGVQTCALPILTPPYRRSGCPGIGEDSTPGTPAGKVQCPPSRAIAQGGVRVDEVPSARLPGPGLQGRTGKAEAGGQGSARPARAARDGARGAPGHALLSEI